MMSRAKAAHVLQIVCTTPAITVWPPPRPPWRTHIPEVGQPNARSHRRGHPFGGSDGDTRSGSVLAIVGRRNYEVQAGGCQALGNRRQVADWSGDCISGGLPAEFFWRATRPDRGG